MSKSKKTENDQQSPLSSRVPGADLIRDIIKHLTDDHLLLFSVILLIFIFSVGSAVFVVIRGQPNLIYLPFVSLLCGLGAVVYTLSTTRVPLPKNETGVTNAIPTPVGNDLPVNEFNNLLSDIGSNLRTALQIDNEVFRGAMLGHINAFRAMTKNWAQHQIESEGRSYNAVLIQLYSAARKSVFSTSMPEYLVTWKGPLGEKLLEAHTKSDAEVLRIFIFDRRDEVTDEAVEAMQNLVKSAASDKMNIRVWIDDEDPLFNFPALLSRDFTIIDDGVAIGITQKVNGDEMSAKWYFQSKEFTPICSEVARHLKQGSKAFDDFLKDWKRRKEQ